jgi:cytoskeletal protein RodZ
MENLNNTDKDQYKDEDYGLPEHAFQPIERKETEMGNVNKPENKPFPKQKDKSYNWPVIIALLVIVGLAAFIVYFFILREPEKPKQSLTEFGSIENSADTETSYSFDESTGSEWDTEKPAEDAVAVETPAEPAKPAVGTITEVQNFTGKSYVIVNSFFDSDLANDRAKELKAEGYEVFILHPTEKARFYRVAVSKHDSYAKGEVAAEGMKDKFGSEIWVLRY